MKIGKLHASAGWYRGEWPRLFGLELLTFSTYTLTIFELTIGKFQIFVGIDRETP